MKLINQIHMTKPTKQSSAAKWMIEGIKQHEEFVSHFQKAKEYALNAGLFFASAREEIADGEWGQFLIGYDHIVKVRTVQRYVEFAQEVLKWVKTEHPKLVGMEKLSAAAREMILQSPKGLVALCRELKLMRKFGEYDEVKYRTKKLLGTGSQIEFEFAELAASIDVLTHFGEENYQFKYPDGVDEVEYMSALESKLEAALTRVRHIKKNGRVIET